MLLMTRLSDARSSWSMPFILLIFFSCGKDDSPENPVTPPLFYTIATSASIGGNITPTQNVPHGQTVRITVDVDDGYTLQEWESDCGTFSSSETTIDFIATNDCQVTAVLQAMEEEPISQTKDCNGQQIPINDTCPNLLVKHRNGVTVMINPLLQNHSQYAGRKATVDDTEYTIVTNTTLKTLVAADNTDAKCTTLVTDMSSLFRNKATFNQDISSWDVSNVTIMDSLFKGATAFDQNISKWDVSRVTDMGYMFYEASAFNQDIGDWNTSQVTTMSRMFRGASAFDQDIGDWDVQNVTDMRSMFYGAREFNHDIGDWNMSNVTDIAGMFYEASAFNQDIGDWDLGKVTEIYALFYRASTFNQNIGEWDVSDVENMSYVFYEANAFNQDIGDWDMDQVTNMYGMFYDVSAFNKDISSWDVSNVTDMSYMLTNSKEFNQNLSGWTVSKVTSCTAFASGSALSQAHRPTFTNCTPMSESIKGRMMLPFF